MYDFLKQELFVEHNQIPPYGIGSLGTLIVSFLRDPWDVLFWAKNHSFVNLFKGSCNLASHDDLVILMQKYTNPDSR